MRLRPRLLSIAILATVSVVSVVTGPAQASGPTRYIFTPGHNPLSSLKHLAATSPSTQSSHADAWDVKVAGVDQNGVPLYRISHTSVLGVKCLDLEASNLNAGTRLTSAVCREFSPSSTQNWRLVPTQVDGKATVKLRNSSSGLVAGVRDASVANGAVVELQVDNDQKHQKFYQSTVWLGD
ncbi:RICIN domain-containing protein [Kribbella sp. CA-253562]|uniref:RICIN domain-containing protein n=1 Tax=Kribbella sp. CA-253562 TaxID=3239942 RepID=UPI003D8E6039